MLVISAALAFIGCNAKTNNDEEVRDEKPKYWLRLDASGSDKIAEAWVIIFDSDNLFRMINYYQPHENDFILKNYSGSYKKNENEVFLSISNFDDANDDMPSELHGHFEQGCFKLNLGGASIFYFHETSELPMFLRDALAREGAHREGSDAALKSRGN
ncbi:hypothetical protein [Oceaniferula spumae]